MTLLTADKLLILLDCS